jgi:hypothetical protein
MLKVCKILISPSSVVLLRRWLIYRSGILTGRRQLLANTFTINMTCYELVADCRGDIMCIFEMFVTVSCDSVVTVEMSSLSALLAQI